MDVTARNKLVEDNYQLVYFVMNKYYPDNRHDEDLLQEGLLGLIKAANTFDESRGSFTTWGVANIRLAMQHEFRRRSRDRKPLSLDALVQNSDDDEATTLLDLLDDTDDYSRVYVDSLISSLEPHLQEVVYLLLAGFTQMEIGDLLGLSRQGVQHRRNRVRRIFNQHGITY